MATDAELEKKLAKLDVRIAELLQDDGDRETLADAYNERGRTLGRLRRFAAADTALRQMIEEFDEDDDPGVVYLVALSRYDRLNYFLRAESYGDALEAADQFMRFYGQDPPRGRTDLLVRALRRKAAALWALGDIDVATRVCEIALEQYTDAGGRTRLALAAMIDEAGDFAHAAERFDLALHFYEAVIAMNDLGFDDDEDLDYYVVCSTFGKAVTLDRLDRNAEENEIWQQLWERFKDESDPPWPSIAAEARFNEAVTMKRLGMDRMAASLCAEILERFTPGESDATDLSISKAVELLEMMIDTKQPPLDVVSDVDRLLTLIENQRGPELLSETLDLTRMKYWWLLQAVRLDEAIAVSEYLLHRLEETADPEARYEIGRAVSRCAFSFFYHSRFRRQRCKPALRLAVLLVDLKSASSATNSPPPRGGPTGLLAATIEVRRKCRTQAFRLCSAVEQCLHDSDDPRLAALSFDARLDRVEALYDGWHPITATQELLGLVGLGLPAAEAFSRRARDRAGQQVGVSLLVAYRMLQSLALREAAQPDPEVSFEQALQPARRRDSVKARLWVWTNRRLGNPR